MTLTPGTADMATRWEDENYHPEGTAGFMKVE
jgi:hypothetical protein